MEQKLFWKSVWRRRASLMLLLALITAASFGFMLRTVEFLTVSREISRLSQSYKAIGTLSSANGDIAEGSKIVEGNFYVDFTDSRRVCPGILTDIYNADLDGTSSDYAENTYAKGLRISDVLVWGELMGESEGRQPGTYQYQFQVKERLYGYPDYAEEGKRITVYFEPKEDGSQTDVALETGKTYLIKASYLPFENTGSYGDGSVFQMKQLEDDIWFLEADEGKDGAARYIDEDALIQEKNRHAMSVATTADMSSMPEVQESARDFYLEAGRWLNREDHEKENKVCVVHKEFASVRNLKVGDTLTVTLEDRLPSYWGYMTDQDDISQKYGESTMELEIVGIYGRLYGAKSNAAVANLTSHSNLMYIPDSCLPKDYVAEQTMEQGMFSFVLTSSKVKDEFIRDTMEDLESAGISLSFVENNWETYYASAKGIEQGVRYSFLVFAAVMAFVLGAEGFFYTWQRRREMAVARSLGVPASKVALCSVTPMLFWGAAGILTGSCLAWNYGLKQAEKTLTVLGEGGGTTLSRIWFGAFCLLSWLVLLLILLTSAWFFAHKPVLEILQGGQRQKQKNKPDMAAGETFGAGTESVTTGEAAIVRGQQKPSAGLTNQTDIPSGRGYSVSAMLGFVWHCLCRFSLRSLFVLAAAAVFVASSGWLRQSIQNSEKKLDKLYRSTVVEAEIIKADSNSFVTGKGGAFIYGDTVQKILDTGFVKSSYLEAGAEIYVYNKSSSIKEKKAAIGIDDLEQFLENFEGGIQLQYGAGYGNELFAKDYTQVKNGALRYKPLVILPETLGAELGIASGDMIYISDSDEIDGSFADAGGFYSGIPVGLEVDTCFIPMSYLELLENGNLNYITAKFTLDPAKNKELDVFRKETEKIFEGSKGGMLKLNFLIWDQELRQVVEPMEKNISLMKILYPLTNIVSIFIAVGLMVLFLFQRKKEAAILRILGVGRRWVRSMLALELLVLNLAGIVLGLGITAALTGWGNPAEMGLAAVCYFGGSLAGLVLGAALVTKEKPLALLQVKE